MKVKIVQNQDKKTVTVVIGEVRFFSAKFLLERYQDKRYFGNGVLNATPEEMTTLLKQISDNLNAVKPEIKVNQKMLFESDDNPFALFRKHINQDGDWDKTFDVYLSVWAEKRERDLFFADLERTQPIRNEDVIKEHEWGLEIELSTNIDDDTLEPKIFVVVHRIIKGKKATTVYSTNDEAWGGFDLGVEETEEEPF